MSGGWQISAGELFEWMRPAAYALSALLSAWVLASARRYRFPLYQVAAWTLGTLLYTLVVLPVYLIVRADRRRQQQASQTAEQPSAEEDDAPATGATIEPDDESKPPAQEARPPLQWTLPVLYLLAALAAGALFYYRDAGGVDAHLARANRARLLGQQDRTISEYRAALKLEEDAHTRNLLGVELVTAGKAEEALAEFRAAERGGEPDDALPYRIALTLDALNRSSEAVPEYQKFLGTRRCTDSYPDPLCAAARIRVKSKP